MPNIKTVVDRKLPQNLDPECKRSQAQGSTGSGHNVKSHAQDMEDFAMGVDTAGRETAQPSNPAKDGARVSGTLPSFLGGRGGY
jgi:hypothetical protein